MHNRVCTAVTARVRLCSLGSKVVREHAEAARVAAQAMAAGELRAATVLGVIVPLLQQMIVEGAAWP